MALNYTNYFRVISASSVCQTLASELIMGWSIHCADLTCWVLALLYSFLLLIYSGRMGCSIITYSTLPTFKRVKYCMSMWSGIFEHTQLVREGSTGFMRLKRAFRKKERKKRVITELLLISQIQNFNFWKYSREPWILRVIH